MDGDWKAACIHDFIHSGLSYGELGKKYNRSRDTIIKMTQQAGVERQVPVNSRGGRLRFDQEKALSPIHKSIGVRMNLYRTLAKEWTTDEAAKILEANRYILRRMELGLHDFSLSQLEKVTEYLGTTMGDLLSPRPTIVTLPQTQGSNGR